MPRVVMVTGLQAAGKTTVGRLLAESLDAPAAWFDGDHLYRMVVRGKADMTPDPSPEALRQVRLRYEASAQLAQFYARHGFNFVYSDIVMGSDAERWLGSISDADVHLVVLSPSVASIAAREQSRGKTSYRDWFVPGGSLEDAIASMARTLEGTPTSGLWLDTSGLTPEEAVAEIVRDDMASSRYRPS